MTETIHTARLDLVAMTPAFLEASLRGDCIAGEALLGVRLPSHWPDQPRLVRRRLEQLRAEPELQPWLLRAIVLRAERRMIGHVGFHSRPGEEYLAELAPGGVEFGYTVYDEHRRRGYAREACLGLMEWAHRVHTVTQFVVSISPANVASLGLAHQLGFVRIGAHIDEEDGPEEILGRKVDTAQ